jgi:hypothetical protein
MQVPFWCLLLCSRSRVFDVSMRVAVVELDPAQKSAHVQTETPVDSDDLFMLSNV